MSNIMKSLLWGTTAVALTGAPLVGMETASAAPNIINTSQKGSLLIYPLIDARENKRTIVRIANDGDRAVWVKCYYGEWADVRFIDDPNPTQPSIRIFDKPIRNFQFKLTPHQPVSWDARTGRSRTADVNVGPFPSEETRTGEMKCWAVDGPAATTQIRWNHLSGTATVIEFDEEEGENGDASAQAYQYTAWASYCRATAAGGNPIGGQCGLAPGRLELDGVDYDQCPRYILGHFTPKGGETVVQEPFEVRARNNYLAVSHCRQDFDVEGSQANEIVHDIVFDIYNEDEIKITGAKETADSWWRMRLGGGDQGTWSAIDDNPDNFREAFLGGSTAYFRAESFAEDGIDTGLVGVLLHELSFDDDLGREDVLSATTVNKAGRRNGVIMWKTEEPTPEKR